MTHRQESGFTLFEIMITVAITAVIILAGVQLFTPVGAFLQRNQARLMTNLEMRSCMETIQRVMSTGQVSTLAISTPPTNPSIPFSQAQFFSVDGSSYTISWSTAPANSIHLHRSMPDSIQTDTILTTHATKLVFTLDFNDPARVKVTLELTVPLNSKGSADSYQTLLVSNRPVVMHSL